MSLLSKRMRSLFAGLALLAVAAGSWAAPREVRIYSKKADYDEKKKMVRLFGNVKIATVNMTMTSPYAEFHDDEKVGDFQGGVKCVGPGSTATGQRMKVFYNDQRAVLTGDCRLISEKGPGAQAGSPTVMWCDNLDYLWATGIGKGKGRVRVRQGNRRAFGDRATYNKNEQVIVLEGNVRFEREANDWLSCERARMDLAADSIVAEGGIVTSVKTDDEKKTKAAPAPPPSQARPSVLEPPYPMKPVEADPPVLLPGLDDRPAPVKP